MQRIFQARSMFWLMIGAFICSVTTYGCGEEYGYEMQTTWTEGDSVVSGKFFNKSNSSFSSVELTIEVRDEDNEVLDSKKETILNIPARGFRDFEVSTPFIDGRLSVHVFVSKINGDNVDDHLRGEAKRVFGQ